MSDMLFIYRWGVEDVSNEGQVTGLKGSRGEKRLIPADWPLEPLCCRERRKGQEEWRETRYSEKKTQMEGGGTSSRVNQNQNREQTYGLSRMTWQRRMDSKVKREGRDVNAASAMVDGVWAQRRLETAAAFFHDAAVFQLHSHGEQRALCPAWLLCSSLITALKKDPASFHNCNHAVLAVQVVLLKHKAEHKHMSLGLKDQLPLSLSLSYYSQTTYAEHLYALLKAGLIWANSFTTWVQMLQQKS